MGLQNSLYRIFSGLMGGLLGTLVIVAVYMFSNILLGNSENPITHFVLIIMIFLGSLIANLSTGAFLVLAVGEKYKRKTEILWHSFLFNLFIFFIAFPFYILLENIVLVAILQLVFSAFFSNIIFEMFASRGEYAFTGLYGSAFASFLVLVVLSLVEQGSHVSSILLFTILPLIWFLLSFLTLLAEWVYTLFYQSSGVAIFDPKTSLE